jgi:hypothetical protein
LLNLKAEALQLLLAQAALIALYFETVVFYCAAHATPLLEVFAECFELSG